MANTPRNTKSRIPFRGASISGWRSWAAWLCLAAWLVATPAVVPLLVGMIGELDGQHQVFISEGRDATRVVLHHEGGAPSVSHRHSVLSKVLVAFSQKDGDTQDHLLVFPRSEIVASDDPAEIVHVAEHAVPEPCVWHACFTGEQLRVQKNFQSDHFLHSQMRSVRRGHGLMGSPASEILRI